MFNTSVIGNINKKYKIELCKLHVEKAEKKFKESYSNLYDYEIWENGFHIDRINDETILNDCIILGLEYRGYLVKELFEEVIHSSSMSEIRWVLYDRLCELFGEIYEEVIKQYISDTEFNGYLIRGTDEEGEYVYPLSSSQLFAWADWADISDCYNIKFEYFDSNDNEWKLIYFERTTKGLREYRYPVIAKADSDIIAYGEFTDH